MTQFHEGEDVEVYNYGTAIHSVDARNWRKAKVIKEAHSLKSDWVGFQTVQFSDGSRGVFDEQQIRAWFCIDCGINRADPPSARCPGCDAYREHCA